MLTSINSKLSEPLPRELSLATTLIGVSYRGSNYRPPRTVSIRCNDPKQFIDPVDSVDETLLNKLSA